MRAVFASSLITVFLFTSPARADATGLQTSAAVDLLGQSGKTNEGRSDRFQVREAEVMLLAPIDPQFDGLLNLAAHQEGGESNFEIHEAYIASTRLIPRSRVKMGQYFLGVGRLNQFHRHDWPFISAPRVQRELFGGEGAEDSGLEASTLLPLPFFLDLTVGVTSGWTFGHAHNEGKRPLAPTHYLRAATYFDIATNAGVQSGLNFLTRTDDGGIKQTYFGLDSALKWRESRVLKLLVQSEVWYRILAAPASDDEKTLGAYIFPQFGFDEQFSFGVRGDYYSVVSLKNAAGSAVDNGTIAVVPTLTYKSSECATFRLAYTREWNTVPGVPTEAANLVELQATFIMGTHPAHDF